MSIVLAVFAACAFGTGDFLGGFASRRLKPTIVTTMAQTVGLVTASLAVLVFPGDGPTGHALLWGGIGGIGAGGGTVALYHGLSVGRMSVVATLSGVLVAVLPVLVGLAQGDSLTLMACVGIGVAIPAIVLVSWHPESNESEAGSGAVWGLLGGCGFALLFISLAQAGTGSGAWPLVSGQVVSVLVLLPAALRMLTAGHAEISRSTGLVILSSGVLAGLASLAFLGAAGEGQLAVVAVLTALYPGITVFWARIVLHEHWNRAQSIGLLAAFAAVVLVSLGSS
jgi:drug/metabolite transporter (DMT)-like permease